MSDENSSSGIGWFIAGLGIGGLLGVLYAPKAGFETRDDIAASARDAKNKAANLVEQGRGQLDEYVDKSKEYIDRGRTQWSQYVDKGKDLVSDAQGKVVAAVDAGKQAYQNTKEQVL